MIDGYANSFLIGYGVGITFAFALIIYGINRMQPQLGVHVDRDLGSGSCGTLFVLLFLLFLAFIFMLSSISGTP